MGRDFGYKFSKNAEDSEYVPFSVSRSNQVIEWCSDERVTREQLLVRIHELSTPPPPRFDRAAVDKAYDQIKHLFEEKFIDDNPAGVQGYYHLLIGDPTEKEWELINQAFVHFNHKGLDIYDHPQEYWNEPPPPPPSMQDVGEAIMVYGFLLKEMGDDATVIYMDYC